MMRVQLSFWGAKILENRTESRRNETSAGTLKKPRTLGFSHNLLRLLVVSQPDKARVPQVSVRRPLGELDLSHYQRL